MEQTVRHSKLSVADLTKMALCVALLAVSGFIRFPLPMTPAPVTAQTLIVNLIALILLPKQVFCTVGVFLALGLVGVPVFGGSGGLGAFAGPTGGYLIGFLIAAPLISLVNQKLAPVWKQSIPRALFCVIVVGMPVIYLFGSVWMSMVMQMDLRATLLSSVVPYLIGDVLKCIAAVAVAVPLNYALKRHFY